MRKVFLLYTYYGDKMEKDLELIKLYDIYGKLLTKKQQDIFSEYYLYDLSLREIAENKKISYQAVRDSIETSKTMLESYENAIHMNKLVNINEKLKKIIATSKDLNLDKEELLELLENRNEDDI